MTKLSIIIPVRNEEKNIQRIVEKIHDAFVSQKSYSYEIIIIDDHSVDKTAQVISKLKKSFPIQYSLKKGRPGKAYSILEACELASSELICMIDADLQYDPSNIPTMLEKYASDSNIGVVIAQRKNYKSILSRKLISRINSFFVGKLLLGLNFDIQSGLKIFRKEIIEHIDVSTIGAWSFDIPLLHTARELGYSITQIPITFDVRNEGDSKVQLLQVAAEILANAFKVKFSKKRIYHVKPHNSSSMVGAGIVHNRKRYITHTTLSQHNSAIKTMKGWQKAFIVGFIGLIMAGVYFSEIQTVIIIFAVLNTIYFIDIFFNLFMTLKTLNTTDAIEFSESDLSSLKDKDLPIYTVLCPLYKEANIIPQFVDAMSKLDWPKDKLDVMLLLEEDDTHTIAVAEKLNLPDFVRIVVVPDSQPKTKPKATNYGLAQAKGEYVVIFDAEDIPDPLQLKKAYLGFKNSDDETVCLQAKLNYYNPHQNLLTRVFTMEYSLWFDMILPGLQSIDAPLPLGGTSNHFKKETLIKLEGWDSFNVTEDCDLGIRLARYGYKTAMIDSVTMEEANSNVMNWINQRSRWIKGYIQSYLVHMRKPSEFIRDNARDFYLFQLVVGGKILALFINPIMWLTTILYFASRSDFGVIIEKFFPGPVLYMGVFSLVFGNFIYLYYYMIASANRKHYSLIKYVYLMPLYWLMMSIASWKAVTQLLYKPHFWQKTVHGLHLEAVAHEIPPQPNKKFSKGLKHVNKLIFVVSIGISSILNFVFSAFLGRALDFENFAIISLLGGLVGLSTIASSAFGKTINYKTSYLIGKYGETHAQIFWKNIRKYSFYTSIAITAIWISATPFLLHFFQTDSIVPLLFFAPVLLVNLISAADRGYIGGNLSFGSLSLIYIFEPLIKLLSAITLVYFGYAYWAYLAIPISFIGIFLIGRSLAFHTKIKQKMINSVDTIQKFPVKFLLLSLISEFSIIFFINFDVILAKHFLTPFEAGQYALVSLASKIIFFGGSFVTPFILPLVSRNEGLNKNSDKILHVSLLITSIVAFVGYLAIGQFGYITTPILFGGKALSVVEFLPLVAGGISFFTISKVFNDYYLVKKHFTFHITALLLSIVQLIFISYYHDTLTHFIHVISIVWAFHFILNVLLHLNITRITKIEQWLLRTLSNHIKSRNDKDNENDKLSLLVFNWRDMKHAWSGGAEVYIHELSKRWVRDGHKVTIFCGNDKKNPKKEMIDGVEIVRRGGFYTVYIWAFLYYITTFRGKYDVIIDSENGIPFFTPLYAKEKVFLLIHHVHQEVFRKSLPFPAAQFALFLEAKVMPLVYRKVQVITVSPSSKKEILKHNLTKQEPVVIFNGVDFNIFKPGEKSNHPTIMYLGRLQYYKSLNVFIKAAKRILEVRPDAEFVIAGTGEKHHELRDFAKKLKIQNKITFLGRVSNIEKVKLFQKSWVFVNPSLMEGWGITTIEANACGTPAVASDVPGLRDSVKQNTTGILVKYGNDKEFADAILELVNNNKLRTIMSNEALKWSHSYDWEESARMFLGEIQKSLQVNKAYYEIREESVNTGLLSV